MSARALAIAIAASGTLLVGCTATPADGEPSEAATAPAAPDPGGDEAGSWRSVPVTAQVVGEAPLEPVMVRARQRVDIDQLSAAIVAATGGVAWEAADGADRFEELASTLGKPDYLERTEEDLWPSALFHKFLDDAARDVCTRLLARELESPPDERTLMVHVAPDDTVDAAPEAVDANLRHLLLRYHGKKLGPDATVLTHWRWLFHTVSHASGAPTEGWLAVCVGLITHTDFYSY